MKSLSRVRLFVTPWTVANQAPPSMGFSRQECSSGLSFPSPEDLPNPRIEPRSPALQADALPSEPPRNPLTKCTSVSVRYYFTPIRFLLLLLLSHISCVRLCDPIDGSLPGSAVPGILQARILEWVAISFSNA